MGVSRLPITATLLQAVKTAATGIIKNNFFIFKIKIMLQKYLDMNYSFAKLLRPAGQNLVINQGHAG